MMRSISILLCAAAIQMSASADVLTPAGERLNNPDNEPMPCHPVPTERQLKWQETEFYAFFHFGMNTFTDLEWGNGNEDPSRFAPTQVPDPRQWLEAVKAAGMKGGIAVVKHHDGFCLWPTETTDHNCTSSSNANAQATNIPRDFANAARELDMKYGFYVSPWDRNSAYYGTDRYVRDVFLRQCAELAAYGSDQFEMWFDGANGGSGYYGGANETRSVDRATYYDVPNLRDTIHSVAPDCVMWGVGGEARWIGNEAGYAGETNWSMFDRDYAGERDGVNGHEHGWIWEPGESDAKATNKGWFWHPGQSDLSAERLFQMYLETVGRNATLILNIPPDRSGRLPESSVKTMAELGALLKSRLGTDLAPEATITASATRAAGANRTYDAANMIDGDKNTYWATDDADTGDLTITLEWPEARTLRYVTLMEHIAKGQRIKEFTLETSTDGENWTRRATNVGTTTVGYKRIIPLNGNTASSYGSGYRAKYLRVTIKDSRACPLIETLSVY